MSSSQRLPIFSTALATAAFEKFVPLPSHTNFTREQFSPASLGRPVNQSSLAGAPLDAGLVERLRNYFRTSDAALQDLLGRSLPWAATSETATKEPRW